MQLNIDGDLKKRTLTSGSLVAGSLTYNEAITGVDAVQVSLTCTIKTVFYRNYGQTQDYRVETNKVAEDTVVVWRSSSGEDLLVGQNFPFQFTVPDQLTDGGPILPSFDAGGRVQRDYWATGTHTRIGWVKWRVEACAIRPGLLKRNKRANVSLVVLPRSDPPGLLPSPVGPFPTEAKLAAEVDAHTLVDATTWSSATESMKLSRGLIFGTVGHAVVILYLPRDATFARLVPVPYLVVIDQTSKKRDAIEPLDLARVSLRLHRSTEIRARRGHQTLDRTFDGDFTKGDRHVFEGPVRPLSQPEQWSQQSAISGTFFSAHIPSFEHHQMTIRYSLRLEADFPGLNNTCKLVTEPLTFTSALTTDETADAVADELPPAYFAGDDDDDDSSDGNGNEKSGGKLAGLFGKRKGGSGGGGGEEKTKAEKS